MARKMLESCPSCGGPLVVTEMQCTRCDTQVRSRYEPGPFSKLSEEQTTFLEIFVTSRGNLSEVEKRLGVSYPTVRAKLDEIIEQINRAEPTLLQPPPMPPSPEPLTDRRAILQAVARGELSPAEGMARIRNLGVKAE